MSGGLSVAPRVSTDFRKFDADMSGALDRKEFVLMCKDMKWDAKSTGQWRRRRRVGHTPSARVPLLPYFGTCFCSRVLL